MITVTGLAKGHGAKQLFRDVTFRLLPGRRIALVGGNGVGKTTLLEIVLGMQDPDSGEIHRGRETRVGYLPQEAVGTADPNATVLEEVLAGAGEIVELETRMRELEATIAATTGPEHDRALASYGHAQSRFEQAGGYALEAEAQRILAGLGFAPDAASKPVRDLSGGWQMRAALARLMLERPDVLVLDEPTNHLDTDSVGWLESTLAAYPGAILFVSHDRDFIDAVAERVVEIAGGTATEYVGGFAEFVVQREDRLLQARAAAANQQRQVAQAEKFVERFRYKATKARQVQSRIKTLERLERIEVPDRKELAAKFAFPEPQRSARVVAELEGVAVGYDGEPVLRDVDLVIERGEKIALVGPNGAGKTTLVRLLLGQLPALEGRWSLGSNVDVAYFAQQQVEALDPTITVLQEFQKATDTAERARRAPGTAAPPGWQSGGGKGRNTRTVLGSFGFTGDAADRKVGQLSGGERTRLALAKIMVQTVNLLILDEPTNHLDLPSCDVLQDALVAYPGTVVLVSHDRYLIREVATSLIAVRDGRVVRYDGVDEAVLSPSSVEAAKATAAAAAATKAAGRASAKPGGPAGRKQPSAPGKPAAAPARGAQPVDRQVAKRVEAETRQKRYAATKELRNRVDKLEKQLMRAEAEVAELQRQLADPAVYEDNDKVKDLVARHNTAKDKANKLMDDWTEASTKLEDTERTLG